MSRCWCCGSTTKIGDGPDSRPEWLRWRCTGCGTFGYVDNPSPSQLSLVYDMAWRDSERSGTYAAGSTDEGIAYSLLRAVEFSPVAVACLDYGGGKGEFARTLISKGCEEVAVFEPYGKDPGIQSVDWISDLKQIDGKVFDWIFMIEVLEHLLDPQDVLLQLRKYLSAEGRLVITTPNARGLRARIDGFRWREAQNPTHINLFSSRALRTCLDRAGYRSALRVHRPVAYRAEGVKAILLSITQVVGVDGGLRFIAVA